MKQEKRIPAAVRILGWVSFFTDVSSEMILPILPLFLREVLRAGMASIGFIEGLADATASLLKVVSGAWSDRMRRRKPLILAGYGLSTVVKPLLALTTQWWHVLGIRFADRVGKGVRTAPRDAVIADVTSEKHRGRSFGFHRAMDTAGAIVGTLLAFLILTFQPFHYRLVFLLAFVPGALALVLILLLRERPREQMGPGRPLRELFGGFDRGYYGLLLLMVFGTFANVSYAFFILRANDLGISARFVPLVYLAYNVVYALAAMPIGILSDRKGRLPVLAGGYVLMLLVMLGFAGATAALHAWGLFLLYGVVSAVLETVPRAFVSDMVKASARGSGLGLYHTTVGLAALPGSVLFGWIWNTFSARVAFYYGAGMSFLALILVFVLYKSANKSNAATVNG